MSFDSLGLSESLLRAVNELSYTVPTLIQLQAIPTVLNGGDLLAGAQPPVRVRTAGFTLPILQRLSEAPHAGGWRQAPGPRASSRLRANSPPRWKKTCAATAKLKSTVMSGGVGINPQIDALRRGVDIVVAMPGRLLDHMQQKTIDLSKLEILVLDEADRMLDMGASFTTSSACWRSCHRSAPELAVLGHALRRNQNACGQPARPFGTDQSGTSEFDC